MHKEKRPVRTGRPTQTRSTRLFRLFLFAIVGDVNSHAHLFPWIGLFVDLHNAAFKHAAYNTRATPNRMCPSPILLLPPCATHYPKERKLIANATIASFSSGFDSAVMMVSATNALSEIRLAPSAHNASFMFKKYRKSAAAMRLLPS